MRCAHGPVVHVRVDVAEMPVVVAVEIRLQAVGREGEEVLVRLVVRGAIVCAAAAGRHVLTGSTKPTPIAVQLDARAGTGTVS